MTGVSSLTSKLIRNTPGTEGGAAAEGSGPANTTSPTSATDAAPGKNIIFDSTGMKSSKGSFHVLFTVFYLKPHYLLLLFSGSEDKAPQASLTHHAASGHANQSQTVEVTDNDEPVGDRWDEEEDWGSLEVELLLMHFYIYMLDFFLHHSHFRSHKPMTIFLQEPEKSQPEDWNTDWSGMASSKKKASDRGVCAFCLPSTVQCCLL